MTPTRLAALRKLFADYTVAQREREWTDALPECLDTIERYRHALEHIRALPDWDAVVMRKYAEWAIEHPDGSPDADKR